MMEQGGSTAESVTVHLAASLCSAVKSVVPALTALSDASCCLDAEVWGAGSLPVGLQTRCSVQSSTSRTHLRRPHLLDVSDVMSQSDGRGWRLLLLLHQPHHQPR